LGYNAPFRRDSGLLELGDAPKSGLRVHLEWKINRPDSVIAIVMPSISVISPN
jgi:hypothetical protein